MLKQEFIVLLYFQKLYNLLSQYRLLKYFRVISIGIYGGEWDKIGPTLKELESVGEFNFWEPYTVKGEEEF
jgi:hypothetical protein